VLFFFSISINELTSTFDCSFLVEFTKGRSLLTSVITVGTVKFDTSYKIWGRAGPGQVGFYKLYCLGRFFVFNEFKGFTEKVFPLKNFTDPRQVDHHLASIWCQSQRYQCRPCLRSPVTCLVNMQSSKCAQ